VDLFTLGGEDDTRARSSTGSCTDYGSLLPAGNSADDRSDTGTTRDDFCVTTLLRFRRSRVGVRRDGDCSVTLNNLGELETDAGPALHSARPFRIDNPSPNLGSFLKERHAVAYNGFRQVCEKEIAGWARPFVALQLAFHMGFRQVVLIGVDHNYTTTGKPNTTVTSEGEGAIHAELTSGKVVLSGDKLSMDAEGTLSVALAEEELDGDLSYSFKGKRQ